MSQTVYPNNVAVRATGMTTYQLQKGRQRETLSDFVELNVTGRAEYTREGMIGIRIINELSKFGIPPRIAKKMAHKMMTDLSEGIQQPTNEQFLGFIYADIQDYGSATYESYGFEIFDSIDHLKTWVEGYISTNGAASIFLPLSDLISKVDEAIAASRAV